MVSMVHTAPRLRPMTLSDILDQAFRLYRNNFLVLLGIVAVLQVPMLLLQLALTVGLGQRFTGDLFQLMQQLPRFDPQQDSFTGLRLGGIALFIVVSVVLAIVQALVVQQVVQGALTSAVADRYLDRPISIGIAYRAMLPHLGALLGAALLLGIIGFVAVAVVGGVFGGAVILMVSLAGNGGSGGSAALTAILLFVVLLFVFVALIIGLSAVLVRFLFFTQAAVVENQGAVGALRRSWQLVRGSYWRVLGITLLIGLLSYILATLPAGIFGFLLQLIFADPINDFAIRQSLSVTVTSIAQMLVLPLQFIAFTLLYYDLRVRKEGYDLQLLAGQTPWQ